MIVVTRFNNGCCSVNFYTHNKNKYYKQFPRFTLHISLLYDFDFHATYGFILRPKELKAHNLPHHKRAFVLRGVVFLFLFLFFHFIYL